MADLFLDLRTSKKGKTSEIRREKGCQKVWQTYGGEAMAIENSDNREEEEQTEGIIEKLVNKHLLDGQRNVGALRGLFLLGRTTLLERRV